MNAIATEHEVRPTAQTAAAKPAKPKKIPDIGLATFITFKPTGSNVEVFPEPMETAKGDHNRLEVTLGNIPLPAGVPAPKNAMTLLYGFRDALDEMKSQYALARQKGHELVKVEFKLQVGTSEPDSKIIMGTAGLEDLPKSKFLNVLRLNEFLTELLLGDINAMLAAEANKSKKAAIFYERLVEAGARPDLLCEAIRKQEIFSHVNSIVYSVPDGTPRGRKVCTIFDTENVIDVTIRGEAPFDIKLPSLS